jgi:hypothetical protein
MIKTIGAWGKNPLEFLQWFDHSMASLCALIPLAATGVLDHLGDEPRTAAELAVATDLDPAQLERLLAFMASQEVLVFEAGRYAHTDFSRLLRKDHPASLHSVVYCGLNLIGNAAALPKALKTRQVAQQVAHEMSYFEQLGRDPEFAEVFARFMTLTTRRAEQFILDNHHFEPFRLAIDVGGSHGSLLLSLLAAHPQAQGILFDLPEVVAQAPAAIARHAAGSRVKLVGGSFFDSLPTGGDLYLLKQILHDWDDQRSLAILKGIRAAIAPGGRLAVLDRLLPETPRQHPAFHMDLYMLLLLGAQERKLSQFENLFGASGFRLDQVTEYPDGPSVMEAVPI